MFNPNRDEARRMFFETWRKYQAQEPVAGIETMVLEVILQHPEYHELLSQAEQYRDRDYAPEHGETNPFLHLSIHLAINEQLSIDQPAGLKQRYAALLTQTGDAQAAQHEIMDCLAEMLWRAQHDHTAFDAGIYLACIDRKLQK